ncbi:hypothetical protein AB5J56_10835 [Streptomyces sp. R21]|uniref:Tetratricopeptide repeat protein n=1 Tax=Streptomyces sp. R21 TaxID=3238627 RepID=A0AB39P5U5_9ACTN
MTRPELYVRAAQLYERAGLPIDAVRCYREGGASRAAADLLVGMGEYAEAVEEYRRAEVPVMAAWILAHHLADPVTAKATVLPPTWRGRYGLERVRNLLRAASPSDEIARFEDVLRPDLRGRLILARCELAEGGGHRDVLPVLRQARAALADAAAPYDPFVEEWAVAVAECAGRFDQVAVLFAASVRGHRLGAAQRWQEWARRVLGVELSIPSPEQRHVDVPVSQSWSEVADAVWLVHSMRRGVTPSERPPPLHP